MRGFFRGFIKKMMNDAHQWRNRMSEKTGEKALGKKNERYEKPKLEKKGRIRDITAGDIAS
jgi:hypothetical protein